MGLFCMWFMTIAVAVGLVFVVFAVASANHDFHTWCSNQGGVTKYISDDSSACFVDGKVVPYE